MKNTLIDACVLYSSLCRDIIMYLDAYFLIRVKWTERIHAEWLRALQRNRPDIPRDKLLNLKNLMCMHTLDAMVEGYEHLIDKLILPDDNDRHVLAAAIYAKCDYIVTFNADHFPIKYLQQYNLQPINLDDLLLEVIQENRAILLHILKIIRIRCKNPAFTAKEFIEVLNRNKLIKFSGEFHKHKDIL